MYLIIHNGDTKGLCDKPRYVRFNNGVLIQCEQDKASHVAIGGNAYALAETIIKETDSAEYAFNQGKLLDETTQNAVDAQDAICILSEDLEARLTDIEDALCEISKEG